jgi:arylsulfatase A-like enzyme
MGNNQHYTRPWHLADDLHPTNWATQQMARTIKRRDPTRPAFWYVSYRHPHPPLVPVKTYLDLYRDVDIDPPHTGDWAAVPQELPFGLQAKYAQGTKLTDYQGADARRAFYALCTHIDHQLRILIGTLREEGLLDNTIICFTSDHGDMLGNHNMWGKRTFYEGSANVPLILIGTAGDRQIGYNRLDDRLVGWEDVMPTLLDLAGIDIPETVEGVSMIGDQKREWFYGEWGEDVVATRMVHDGRYKLIYYPAGNCSQLFDLQEDPQELIDLSTSLEHADILARLTGHLITQLYGGDETWVQNGQLVGLPAQEFKPGPNRGLSGQRGSHWPPPSRTEGD